MKRKILSFMMVGALCLNLVACTNGKTAEPSAVESAESKATTSASDS